MATLVGGKRISWTEVPVVNRELTSRGVMKTCSVCGLHVEDDYLYCWEDGTRLNESEAVSPPQSPSLKRVASEQLPAAARENEETEEQRVLYCPVCTGAFPLTFVTCPIDHLPLTMKLLTRRAAPEIRSAPVEPPAPEIAKPDAALQLTPPALAAVLEETMGVPGDETEELPGSAVNSFRFVASRWDELRDRAKHLSQGIISHLKPEKRQRQSSDWGVGLLSTEDADPHNTPKGMRLAARATAIGLILITLAGIYTIYSLMTRTPLRYSRIDQDNIVHQESPLIATPQQAREYKAEPESQATSATDDPGSGAVDLPPRVGDARGVGVAPRTALAAPARSGQASVAAASYDSRTPVNGGRFSTQLVRVRSYRSPSGYRYTLTFTLFEQAGRSMQWERLSIVTQSANGATHSESLPFQYVLAGSGAMTFTVNVEMAGASEADWRGHISCMSVGADDSGRPLRASFGADVAPL
jgi:hypothetical protein